MFCRVLFAFVLGVMCTTSMACAADVPYQAPELLAKTKHLAKIAPKKRAQMAAAVPAKPLAAPSRGVNNAPSDAPNKNISGLTWVLPPLVANADGGKKEGSASSTGNIVVDTPGMAFGPEVLIELQGHVVKTAHASVRIDVQVNGLRRTVQWAPDDIKSGMFNIALTGKVSPGVLPGYIPVSALTFVSQDGTGSVAMVSLEKIIVKFSGSHVASIQEKNLQTK